MFGILTKSSKYISDKFRSVLLALAKRKSPVYALVVDGDAVVSGEGIKLEVSSGVRHIAERLGVKIIHETENPFGVQLLVSDEYAGPIFGSLDNICSERLITNIFYIDKGRRQRFTVSSIGTADLARKRIQPDSIYCMRFHKGVRASNSIRSYGASFKSEIRFLRDGGKWWLNPLTDIESPDIEKSRIAVAILPATTRATFPIDIVYTWVDGSDARWIERKDAALRALGRSVPEHSADRSRWEDHDELRHSLRSVALFAPWIRRIFLVTDDQAPGWLRRDAAVTVVDHRELFPAGAALPTFNSHAIEAVLHRIEGLSEHFLYMNDDFFFGSAVTPNNFFTAGGLSRVFLSPSSMPIGDPAHRDRASEWGGMNASRLIEGEFGRIIRRKSRHTPMALRVSVLREIEERYPDAFAKVRSSQFRDPSDIAPVSSLYPHYALVTGRAVDSRISYGYFNTDNPSAFRRMRAAMRRGSGVQVFCLNDSDSSGTPALSRDERGRQLRDFLGGMYPWKSPWET